MNFCADEKSHKYQTSDYFVTVVCLVLSNRNFFFRKYFFTGDLFK